MELTSDCSPATVAEDHGLTSTCYQDKRADIQGFMYLSGQKKRPKDMQESRGCIMENTRKTPGKPDQRYQDGER